MQVGLYCGILYMGSLNDIVGVFRRGVILAFFKKISLQNLYVGHIHMHVVLPTVVSVKPVVTAIAIL